MSKEVVMSGKRRGKTGSSARTQGARRATGGGADGGALAPGQRWSAVRISAKVITRSGPL